MIRSVGYWRWRYQPKVNMFCATSRMPALYVLWEGKEAIKRKQQDHRRTGLAFSASENILLILKTTIKINMTPKQ